MIPSPNASPLSTEFQPSLSTSESVLQRARGNSAPVRIQDNARMIDALRPFVNESSSNVTDPDSRQSVDKYRNILTRVVDAIRIDVTNENRMKQHWSDLAKKSTTVSQPNDNQLLRVLVEAGMKWLESGSANVDVLRTDPNHKALLFKIGSDVDVPDGETLVRGNTFAQSRDVKSIAAELKSLK